MDRKEMIAAIAKACDTLPWEGLVQVFQWAVGECIDNGDETITVAEDESEDG